jgi:hypothetical protein
MNSVDSVFGLRIMMFSVGFKWLCPLNDPVDASDDSPSVAMCNGVSFPLFRMYEINQMLSPIVAKRHR